MIWAAGLNVFRQHSFAGVGAGAFGPSVAAAIDINYVAHNSFLSVLVELGVVGEMILLALLASSFYLALRMGGLDRWLWIALLLTWASGAASLTWEYRKATWFLFGMVAAEAGLVRTVRRPAVTVAPSRAIAARRERFVPGPLMPRAARAPPFRLTHSAMRRTRVLHILPILGVAGAERMSGAITHGPGRGLRRGRRRIVPNL